MKRYVAFLRGVSPMNAKMAELKRVFEKAGFSDVKTVLGSGNVVFSAERGSEASLARRSEELMRAKLAHPFAATVRSVESLERLIARDPFANFELPPKAKRVVTFLFSPSRARLALPIEFEDAVILERKGSEVFSAYVPGPKGPTFMRLIEKTFGKEVTTRTWETVLKVSK